MVDRIVTVPDSLELPTAVKVPTARLSTATATGKAVLDAADAAAARTAIGAAPALGAKNLVVNGDFSQGTDNWSTDTDATMSATNGVLTVRAGSRYRGVKSASFTSVIGNQYYFAADLSALSTNVVIKFYDGAFNNFTVAYPSGATGFQRLSRVSTSTASSGNACFKVQDDGTVWQDFQVKNAIVIDLTATFGAGNEPSQTEMDYLLAKYPNRWFNGTVNNLVPSFDPKERFGTGMPNGVVTANPGTYYTDTAGTSGAWRWLKKSGTGNTGWECVIGDTGWRKTVGWSAGVLDYGTMPDGLAPPSGVSGGIFFRRIQQTVYLNVFGAQATKASQPIPIPTGYSPGAVPYPVAISASNTNDIWNLSAHRVGASFVFATFPNGNYIPANGSSYGAPMNWTTVSAWPSTLPGVPA